MICSKSPKDHFQLEQNYVYSLILHGNNRMAINTFLMSLTIVNIYVKNMHFIHKLVIELKLRIYFVLGLILRYWWMTTRIKFSKKYWISLETIHQCKIYNTCTQVKLDDLIQKFMKLFFFNKRTDQSQHLMKKYDFIQVWKLQKLILRQHTVRTVCLMSHIQWLLIDTQWLSNSLTLQHPPISYNF